MEYLIALIALTALEIVLGIDNIVFIAILTDKLPEAQQSRGRRLGLALAMVMRLLLLFSLSWILGLSQGLFELTSLGLPASFLPAGEHGIEVNVISGKDLILFAGGLFLIWKSVTEIHEKIEQTSGHGADAEAAKQGVSMSKVLLQIAVMDLVFSLDSVITAVGMAEDLWVMVAAIIIAVGVMLVFADRISGFIDSNPTVKMLALSFLILIGVMLTAEAMGMHIKKGYIYFAMAFALFVEVLNMRTRQRRSARQQAAAADAEVA